LSFAIKIPAVQTFIVKKVGAFFSSEWDTKVEVSRVEIVFFDSVKIEGLFIGDQRQDTLIHVEEATANISLFSLLDRKLVLEGIVLKEGTAKISRNANDGAYNFKFLTDYFEQDTTIKRDKPFLFEPGNINLEDFKISYRDYRRNTDVEGINYDNIRCEVERLNISGIKSVNGTMKFNVRELAFKEQSGFEVRELTTEAIISDTSMSFTEMKLLTPLSSVEGNFSMLYEQISDFDSFIDKVKMKLELGNTTLSSDDLAFFAPELKGSGIKIGVAGTISGTVDRLKGSNLDIRYGNNTVIQGSTIITGLPDIDETYFDLDLENVTTDHKDLATLPSTPFSAGQKIQLPVELARFGTMEVSGKFNGFLKDFVAYANFKSNAGFLSTDVNLKIGDDAKSAIYSGHLNSSGLDLGLITGNKEYIGKTSFKIKLEGRGLDKYHLDAKLTGDFTSLNVLGYNYTGLTVNGRFRDRNFDGGFMISDPNLEMDFNGLIDLKSKVPYYALNVDVTKANPALLGLIDRDATSTMSFSADINMRGNGIKDFEGSAFLNKVYYAEVNQSFEIDEISLDVDESGNEEEITLESDLMDLSLKGRYDRLEILDAIQNLLASNLPIISSKKTDKNHDADLTIAADLKNLSNVLDVFYPKWQIADHTKVNGRLSTEDNSISMSITSDSIRYDMALFEGLNTEINTKNNRVYYDNRFDRITINDTLILVKPYIKGDTDTKNAKFTVASESRDTLKNDVYLTTDATFNEDGSTSIHIGESDIVLNGKKWKSNEKNLIVFDSDNLQIQDLGIESGNEKVSVSGTVSKSNTEKLTIQLENFGTEILNPILAVYGFNMSGTATGTAEISSFLSKPGITSKMQISELAVYGDTLGNADIDMAFDSQKNEVDLNGTVDKDGNKSIEVRGTYYIQDPEDRMDFTLKMQKTSLGSFAEYTKGIISDLRGKASGELRLTGNFKEPLLTGKIRLQQTSFLFDYLNTRYSLSDEIEFNERYFRIKNLTVNDENGNQAKVDGFVYHNHLSDFSLKFDINAKNFQMLNTGPKQNELYYGKAYGSGKVRVVGPLDLIKIEMALKTEKNTSIQIPLSNPEEVTQSGFINFIKKDSTITIDQTVSNEFKGIDMRLELAVTPDAEVQLIFDSKIGDIIKGRSNGNIQMTIDRLGDFKMFGNITVESGDYLFTLQNLINKKFIISPGGTIKWTGDPYDATVDLLGIYKLRSSLYDLIKDSTLTQRIPVEVHLKLKEKLFNPTIEFDVIIPDIDPTAQALMNRYISTDQDKSTQTMSLLVLNRFSQANDVESQSASSSSGIGANAAELLSQQLSVWASQISDAFNVGVNYRAADAFSQEEYELELSTRLWNDRISIDGNLGLSDNRRNTTSGIVGDFNAEVKVSKDGRFRFKVFNKTINNILSDYNSPYTQGLGILYRKEFDTWEELFKKYQATP
jgi:archaellum component FlaF (FlaF/FlaG flagellin family)